LIQPFPFIAQFHHADTFDTVQMHGKGQENAKMQNPLEKRRKSNQGHIVSSDHKIQMSSTVMGDLAIVPSFTSRITQSKADSA